MRETERIKRINNLLDSHFKSNKGCWWVSNNGNIIELHKGAINNRLKAVQIAKFIFSKEKTARIIHYSGGCILYTRESVKNYQPRKKQTI